MTLGWLDILVLVLYFGVTIGMGFFFARKNTDTEEYFLGGRSLPGWAIGLSLLGTSISSVTFVAFPADTFKTTWIRFLPHMVFPLVTLISARLFLPFFRRGTISSAYEYLGERYGGSISCYAASVFFLIQVIRTSTIVYLISLLMQTITGLDIIYCILLSGGITAVYTTSGGFDAVIWTDVLQTLTLIFGSVLILIIISCNLPEGFSQIISTGVEFNKFSFHQLAANGELQPLAHGFSLSEKTVMMMLIVGFVNFLTGQFDQTAVQRWCSAKSAKEARRSIYFLMCSSLPVWGSFMLVGTAIWVYFHCFPDAAASQMLDGTRKAEEIVPYFVIHYLPPGITGLVIAAAMAAAMSSLSSSINAASMVWVRDIYRKFMVKDRDDKHYLRIGFVASGVVSVLMMIGAYWLYTAPTKTLIDFGMILNSLTMSGLAGVFLIGMFTRLADSRAVWAGILFNMAFSGYALLSDRALLPEALCIPFDLYFTSIVGNVIMIGVIVVAARFVWRSKKTNLKNLTFRDQEKTALL
ncbi:sodium:solute symporter family transporter [Tichowtungia aerotolerans]|uniref:Sodium/solute symporter n=1 Tax=Tichowtungia aerotolerans TaxID=2697043 RepID=A0A6P1M475_9BACT|nr:sodium/solute symporter [Tichowtungia aerotolerans]QHI69400.1 sodium/solute symporter [Tichowtungia aerotolerans]